MPGMHPTAAKARRQVMPEPLARFACGECKHERNLANNTLLADGTREPQSSNECPGR
jgi:hypothetical protein